jgi:hypothetical protein
MKAFIAFSMRQEGVDSLFFEIKDKLAQAGAVATSSIEYHRQTFHDAGGWDQWIEKVVSGTNYLTRQPNFDVLVCTKRVLGRATAQMVEGFLAQGKEVLHYEDGSFSPVLRLQENDDEDWQTGWSLIVEKY